MANNRRGAGARRTGALTRASVRRGSGSRPPRPEAEEETEAGGRLRFVKSPTTWLLGILLAVATVTFQDVLTATVKAVLPLDRVPDRLSPQNAIDVVDVKDVKDIGYYVVRDGGGAGDGRLLEEISSGGPWREGRTVVDAGESDWMITVQGRASQQVRITDIVPVLEGGACEKPLGGSLAHFPSQGVSDVIPLELEVDAPRPRLKTYGKEGKDAKPFFTGPQAKHITLNQNETEAFIVHATSETGYCRWRYRVHYEVGGSTAETTISGPGGKPFELTARLPDASAYRKVYFPGLDCVSPASRPLSTWYEQTGPEYARARSGDRVPPCPKS
ncbi:hypothetical protein ACF058_02115 [Streptomyces sp. NPDC015501]|uniref:hypothetical protein n=1 Tax=unclassified Streptomyces TaxID=2593676 RepID=UPI0011A74859|nr:hypothetical protein A3L22_02090 [Streptomyces griseus subsp. griseus]WSS57469.1 hypothetical protein OG543_19940 [Streptomyces sp. NBC_01178]